MAVRYRLLNRSEKRVWFIEPDALLLIAAYALGLWMVYQAGAHHRFPYL